MQAAPNLTSLVFKLLSIKEDNSVPQKYNLDILILDTSTQKDRQFIKPSHVYHAILFYPAQTLSTGHIYQAQGEYIGGPKNGTVHLSAISDSSEQNQGYFKIGITSGPTPRRPLDD